MLQWAQNWARSKSVWPLGYGLACCAIEMIASASAPQYDLSRFGSEVFRSSPRQADLMIVGQAQYRLRWDLVYAYCGSKCLSLSGLSAWASVPIRLVNFMKMDDTVQGVETIVPVDVYVPGGPPRPEAFIEGLLKLREKIAKQGLQVRSRKGTRESLVLRSYE